MIEIIYEKEKQKPEGNEEFFRIPNNIRQIGEVGGVQKIYIEDYAYTYLCRISSENSYRGVAAILLGQANWRNGTAYLFVKSAIVLTDMEVNEEHLVFTQEIWNHVYEKNKEYFTDQEVVGWFLSIPGCSMELHEVICQTHLNHFGGNDKVLFVMEPLEKEEAFYRYEDGKMSRQTGFYVYYEKNEPMRNYLISQNERLEKRSEEVDDSAVRTFRKKVETKTEQGNQKQQFSVSRAAGICAAAVVLAVGVLYLNDYQKLKSTEMVIADLDKEREEKQLAETLPVNGTVDTENENTDKQAEDKDTENKQAEGEGDSEKSLQESGGNKNNTGEEKNISEEKNTGVTEDNKEAAAATHRSYIIQQGDTITKISIRNYGNIKKIKEICELNHIAEDDLIYPGQKILLP